MFKPICGMVLVKLEYKPARVEKGVFMPEALNDTAGVVAASAYADVGVGQGVLLPKHGGKRLNLDGAMYRLVDGKEILAEVAL